MDVFDLSAIIRLDSSEYEQGLSNAESKASKFGKAIKTASKVGAVAFAATSAVVTGVGVAIAKGTGAVASYGDNIDKMSQKMGISTKAYQEWDAVLKHSGTSIDAMKRGMTTLAKAAESGKDSFSKLGITQEELQTLNQEELFARTIEGLQSMEEGTERTVLANELLGGSAKELGALLNTSAEDTQAMKDRVNELGGVMSDDAVKAAAKYQDSLQDMNTAFSSISRDILSDFLPSMSTVMDGLTEIFVGDKDKGIALVTEGISGLITNLQEAIPTIASVGGSIVQGLVGAIMSNMPSLLAMGLTAIVNFALGIIEKTPAAVSAMSVGIVSMIDGIREKLPEFLDKGTEIIGRIINGILTAIPSIITSIGVVITSLITAIVEDMPMFLEKGMELIAKIANGVLEALPFVLTAISVMLGQLFVKLGDSLPEFLAKGVEFLQNIMRGIADTIPVVLVAISVMLAQLFAKLIVALPDFLAKGADFIANIVSGIAKKVPDVLTEIGGMIRSIFEKLVDNMPVFLQKGVDFLTNIVSGIAKTIPVVLVSISVMLAQMIANIIAKLPDFLAKGVDIIKNIVTGIVNNIPTVVASIADMIAQMLANIVSSLPDFLQKGLDILGQIVQGIINAVPDLLAKVGEIPGKIIDIFTNINWLSIGSSIMNGIKDGIVSAAKGVADAALNAAKGALDAVTGFLHINSPSRLFRDKVGKSIPEGMALGILDGIPEVMQAADEMGESSLVNLDDIGYDTDTMVSKIGDDTKDRSGAQIVEAVRYLTETIEQMDEQLQDKMLTAFESMRFSVGNREFARMVRDVRTA